jgi:predicted glycosyltransferase
VSRRVFLYVQHLLGVGHVFRAVRIARGLRQQGFDVDLALGGIPLPGLEVKDLNVVQLTPVKAGADGFSNLVTASGEAISPDFKERRRRELLEAFTSRDPDVLLIEAFPFGRRQMRFELMPLLEAAHSTRPRPLVVSSIRDILQENAKPGRAEETVVILQRYFDHVIVHGSPDLARLHATFPMADRIASMTAYSGLVGPQPAELEGAEVQAADVIVSAGGGAVGRRLLEMGILAKPVTPLAGSRWLAVAGPNAEQADFEQLTRLASQHDVQVERFLPNFAGALRHARLTISQAGYNTVADILSAGCKAVLVPYAEQGETEQSRRAALLEERGLAVAVGERDLTPERLADAVGRALRLPSPRFVPDLSGAARTGGILKELLLADKIARPGPRH